MNGRMPRPRSWADLAVCAETDPELFFPANGTVTALAAPVRVLCRSCEVREDCLRFAFEHHEQGIWGGFTEQARSKLLTRHRKGTPLADIIAEDDAAYFASAEAELEARRERLERRRALEREQRREKARQIRRAA